MAHVIRLAVGAFISSCSVKCRTKSWEAHKRDQPYEDVVSIDIGKSQRIRKEGNSSIDKVSAMGPGLAKIIDKVGISRNFESPATDLYIAANDCCIDYADTGSSERLHRLPKIQITHHSTTYSGCENMLEFEMEVV